MTNIYILNIFVCYLYLMQYIIAMMMMMISG